MQASQTAGAATCSKNRADVGEVRNQGSCGQCWTFSTAALLRAAMIEQKGHDPGKLSTQFLTNCMRKTSCSGGVDGCCGGDPASAVRWIRQQGGIPTQAVYGNVYANTALPEFMQLKTKRRLLQTGPVSESGQGITYAGHHPTQSFSCKSVAKAVTAADPTRHTTESDMQNYICNTGSLMVAVEAHSWQTYAGGVMTPASCGTRLDHAVLLSGVSREHNAWIIRNSWGEGWGASPTDPNAVATKDKYSNCAQLKASYGCSVSLSGGETMQTACAVSCPASGATSVKAGYIWLQYGSNTCGITGDAWSVTPELVGGSGSTSSTAASSPSTSAGSGSASSTSGCEDLPVCTQISNADQMCEYVKSGRYVVRLPGSGTMNDNCKKTCGMC